MIKNSVSSGFTAFLLQLSDFTSADLKLKPLMEKYDQMGIYFTLLCPKMTVQNQIIPSFVRVFPNILRTQKKIFNIIYGF